MSVDLSTFNPFDPQTLQCPFPHYAQMRDELPVMKIDSLGMFLVTRHDLVLDILRDLAHTIPFDMVKEVLFVGNTEELAGQFEAYARNGLEHVVLANITGVVGGMDEIMARGMELPTLKNVLSEL